MDKPSPKVLAQESRDARLVLADELRTAAAHLLEAADALDPAPERRTQPARRRRRRRPGQLK